MSATTDRVIRIKEGVRRELLAHGKVPPFWVQAFDIPARVLRIADFRAPTSEGFLNSVFWFCEVAGIPEQGVDYKFSRTIGDLVASTFAGMILPGVRGADGFVYSNLVLFRPWDDHHSWKDFLANDESPHELPGTP